MVNLKQVTIAAVVTFAFVKYLTIPDQVSTQLDLPELASTPAPIVEYIANVGEPSFVPVPTAITAVDRECLAKNIYFEAKNQSLTGQMAVGIVTLKRVESNRFPNTICGVVTQTRHTHANGFPVKHKCQFSWYCDGKKDTPINPESWELAQHVAGALLSKESSIADITNGADHYHADYINPPVWTSQMVKVARIENHIFYTTTSL